MKAILPVFWAIQMIIEDVLTVDDHVHDEVIDQVSEVDQVLTRRNWTQSWTKTNSQVICIHLGVLTRILI